MLAIVNSLSLVRNTVLCRFGRWDPIVKNKLFQAIS